MLVEVPRWRGCGLQVVAEEEGEYVNTIEVGKGFGGGGVDWGAVSCALKVREEINESCWWDGDIRCERGKVFDIQ